MRDVYKRNKETFDFAVRPNGPYRTELTFEGKKLTAVMKYTDGVRALKIKKEVLSKIPQNKEKIYDKYHQKRKR